VKTMEPSHIAQLIDVEVLAPLDTIEQ